MGISSRQAESGSLLEIGRGDHLGPPVSGADPGSGIGSSGGVRLRLEKWPYGQNAKEKSPQLLHSLDSRFPLIEAQQDTGGNQRGGMFT